METATKTEPTIRVRIAHASTVKEGWRCSETTVEYTTTEMINWERIANTMRAAYSAGEVEAEYRNKFNRSAS